MSPVVDFCDGCFLTHKLPAGTWVDHWSHSQKYVGPGHVTRKVPLGQLPIYYKEGSIIPIAAGLLVVPGTSRGRARFYYDGWQLQLEWAMDPSGVRLACSAATKGGSPAAHIEVEVLGGGSSLLSAEGQHFVAFEGESG